MILGLILYIIYITGTLIYFIYRCGETGQELNDERDLTFELNELLHEHLQVEKYSEREAVNKKYEAIKKEYKL